MPIELNRIDSTRFGSTFRNGQNNNVEKLEKAINHIEKNNEQAAYSSQVAEEKAKKANELSNSIKEQLTQMVKTGDSSVEAAAGRVDAKGKAHPMLKDRLDSDFKTQDKKINELLSYEKKLMRNIDFEQMPFIQSRSYIYSFLASVTSPQLEGKKSLKIEAQNYESSIEPNKDFAFLLNETIMPLEKITISFWAYPLVSSKKINIRMAYATGVNVDLGKAGEWNKVSFTLDLATMSRPGNYLYFNLLSSFVFYMSDLQVTYAAVVDENAPRSFNQVNKILAENPSIVYNSKGSIERIIDMGQSYLNNINKLVYGNVQTAYDATVGLVNGKNEIDCSSFANLLMHGIPFENSRYNGNIENIGSNLFFQNIDAYKYRYANQIAKYAFESGYAFKVNPDFSNVKSGDLLFFSWDSRNNNPTSDLSKELRENAFMKIDHVAVFLHKKNDSLWSTLQFDNNISTVYYEASNEYMSQCVLAARFPLANVESMYPDDNILIAGDAQKSVSNTTYVSSYKLTKPFKKGRYYTFVFEGQVYTDNCYFVILANNKTIYSDYGKIGRYNGINAFRFPYLSDDFADTITLAIGAPVEINQNRSASVNWCSLYEGYVRNKRHYSKGSNAAAIKSLPLDQALALDLNANFAPYYKYGLDGNKIFINFSLPFNTLRTGELYLGNIGIDAPKNTQRLPTSLIGANNESVNAILQINWNGDVTIIPYISSIPWKMALVNGCIFKE
ncbi:phage baseplate upper protein [Bacillus thuringiensis]|uniref:phage baseplate upper protein n=1 Tax=Bacillus thuringiensis TaxID=1428 RepID=UPI003BF66A24